MEVAQDAKVVRNCIMCDENDYTVLFTFTYDFCINVRGHSRSHFESIGWGKDTTSSIVQCRSCGCCYTRDPFIRFEQDRRELPIEEVIEKRNGRSYNHRTFQWVGDIPGWSVRMLLYFASARFEDVRFLDYGAGAGVASHFARTYGVTHVLAYEPFQRILHHYERLNCPGIATTNSLEEVRRLSPFEAINFIATVEHVLSPRGELETISDLLVPGGYLMVSNPYMPIRKHAHLLSGSGEIPAFAMKDYHPGHINFFTPYEFAKLLGEVGFRIIATPTIPPIHLHASGLKRFLKGSLRYGLKFILYSLGIHRNRYMFVVQKPSSPTLRQFTRPLAPKVVS